MRRLTVGDVRMMVDDVLRLNRIAGIALHSVAQCFTWMQYYAMLYCAVHSCACHHTDNDEDNRYQKRSTERWSTLCPVPLQSFRSLLLASFLHLPSITSFTHFNAIQLSLSWISSFISDFLFPWSDVDQIVYLHTCCHIFLHNICVRDAICIDMVSHITSRQRL